MKMTIRGRGRLLVAGFAMLGLGCQTLPGPGPYPNPSRVAQGAIVGSMAGAAIGAGLDYHDRGRGALLGAVGGLLVGALFGGEAERHQHAWQRSFHDPAPDAGEWCDGDHAWDDDSHTWDDDSAWQEEEEEEDEVDVAVPVTTDVLFDPDSAALSRGAKSRLRWLADRVREDSDVELLLRGHSDGVEGDAERFELSEQRARAVRAYLKREGVPARRIAWVGFGSAQPVASNGTPEGRQRNRRVEIVLREPDWDARS